MEKWANRVKELNKESKVRFNGGCTPEEKNYKPEDLIFNALSKSVSLREAVRRCPKGFALAVGHAHSPYPLVLEHSIEGKCRDLYEWLIVDGEMPWSAEIFLRSKASYFADTVDVCSIVSEVYNEAEKRKGLIVDDALASIGYLAIAGGKPSNCLEKASKLILIAISHIPGSVKYLEGELEILIRELINRGLAGLALAIVGSAMGQDLVGFKLYHLVSQVLNGKALSWTELVHWAEVTLVWEHTRVEYFRLYPNVSTCTYIVDIVDKICEHYKGAICYLAESILGAKLTVLYNKIADTQNRDFWLRRADNALKKLKTLSESDEDILARDLADFLKLMFPFTPSKEALHKLLSQLNAEFNYYASLVKLSVNDQEAARYAERACEEAKKFSVPKSILPCNLKARIYFIQGREKEAIKLFKENAEDAVKRGFIGMDRITIGDAFTHLVASHVAEGDREKALEEYKRYAHIIIVNYPAAWALLTGLMVLHDVRELEEAFEKAMRMLLMQLSPLWIKPILKCVYSSEGCVSVDPCEELKKTRDYDNCRRFVELADNLERLKKFIITRARDEVRDIFKVLLDDINDYRQIIEVVALTSNTVTLFAEVLRLISHGEFSKARAIAEHTYNLLGNIGQVQESRLWRELYESLGEEGCGDRCRKALQKLFFYIV